SITKGLLGQKGKIHLEFCPALQGDFENSKAIAKAIDEQIIGHYQLFDSNLAAFAHLNNKFADSAVLKKLKERMKNLDELQQHWLLTMYANPVLAKLSLNQ
ncbi:MAG: 1-acyl-sn-glycerol-3-phosphate acyltransferase, partial [Colwellia sp.]|nr:1-acyl-sn-glycerol-3-phosphate acyltransferase [Colwellia sp.]